jgi:hypothetical protein
MVFRALAGERRRSWVGPLEYLGRPAHPTWRIQERQLPESSGGELKEDQPRAASGSFHTWLWWLSVVVFAVDPRTPASPQYRKTGRRWAGGMGYRRGGPVGTPLMRVAALSNRA